jgi:hypothetical protein
MSIITKLREENKLTLGNMVLFYLQIAYIIGFIIAMPNIYKNEVVALPSASIQNYDKLGLVVEEDAFTNKIYQAVSLNTDRTIKDDDIQIRESSIIKRNFANNQVSYVYYIVDIPSLQQSYQIAYYESSSPYFRVTNNTATVMCLPDDLQIYDFKNCVDAYNREGAYNIVAALEQFMNGHADTELNYTYKIAKNYNREQYLDIKIITCNGKPYQELGFKRVSDFIKSLGFRLSDFRYQVTNRCER